VTTGSVLIVDELEGRGRQNVKGSVHESELNPIEAVNGSSKQTADKHKKKKNRFPSVLPSTGRTRERR